MIFVIYIFLDGLFVVAGGKCWIHKLPVFSVKFDDIIHPAFVIYISADPGVVSFTGITDFQFGRNSAGNAAWKS